MKKQFFLIRLLTFPLKLIFNLFWFLILSVVFSYKWLIYGSHEIVDGKTQLIDEINRLISINEKLIEKLNNNS